MKLQTLARYSLILGVCSWIWNLSATESLGGYRYLFNSSLSFLKYGEIWDALVFIIVGIILLLAKATSRLWWLEAGLVACYLAKFAVAFSQDTSLQTLVVSTGFCFFVIHLLCSGNLKSNFQRGNLALDRVSALVALIPLSSLILGWALPWSRHTYQTDGNITFQGNGKSTLITECCTVLESPWQSNAIVVNRFLWIFCCLLLIILGYRVSRTVFIPALVFSFYEVSYWVSNFGSQKIEPNASWTQEMIDQYHYKDIVTGLPGGFIFAASIIALVVILLIPIAVKNSNKSD